ncbi:hypothetical protein [Rhodovastum atsumiense]|uniref:Uncharacterized protein n=1 Tax=Rhodovastum atsumiense TaxID=504468 RepID=A0A5M6IHQ4_9PROT|nr:hypothetical protein [Rhodovastum atsumiense]KAA5607810.1 hypothetical protein F1189_31935 [Rhodovastum atsumiense]
MFLVDEATAAAIREAYQTSGELAAAVELRRHFPGIENIDRARECARMIASWGPRPPDPDPPAKAPRARRGKNRSSD